eukprot:TRINITY_DN11651_c0_g1_i2.p1 TRINITY_DN11651_c0_g1~~TRINITY_DN11651_c0_g1_i2.p1  ORF type:complete len:321 (-),score=46.98 TRINITY_DN11651_c0_g1_i2:133-1095(-)
MSCPRCGSHNIETREDEGIRCCTECGELLPYDALRIELSWLETAGSSSVSGQTVAIEASSSSKVAHRIRELSFILGLKDSHTEGALRLYKLACTKNFSRGRRVDCVAVSCLYAVCRRTHTPYLLIDFADKVNINVWVLGHTFLAFCTILCLELDIVDPSLYLDRFAARLEFGSKESAVTATALKFVQRMDRDWIRSGRRPAGICGAALLMAARVYGFDRTPADIVHIVRIGDHTLMKRIREFLLTPSSSLTIEQLEADVEVDGETLPPVMYQSQLEEERKRLSDEMEGKESCGDGDDHDGDGNRHTNNHVKKGKKRKRRT